ncbi:hypothetical protein PMAYCL1PPCAC_13633, partial [Pristionchus mayeri]
AIVAYFDRSNLHYFFTLFGQNIFPVDVYAVGSDSFRVYNIRRYLFKLLKSRSKLHCYQQVIAEISKEAERKNQEKSEENASIALFSHNMEALPVKEPVPLISKHKQYRLHKSHSSFSRDSMALRALFDASSEHPGTMRRPATNESYPLTRQPTVNGSVACHLKTTKKNPQEVRKK